MADIVEIHKLKLAELKQECLARGLDVKGNKSDLVNRLQTYLDEHAEEEANEEDVLGDETEEEEQKPVEAQAPLKEDEPSDKPEEKSQHQQMCSSPSGGRGEETLSQQSPLPFASIKREEETEKKLVKITGAVPQTDRLQKRAERFSVPANADSKKAARAIRFGLPSTEQKGETTAVKTPVNIEKLKERAQRFGLSVSPVTKKNVHIIKQCLPTNPYSRTKSESALE
ncbi:SAP domain-containing ribonucleoprotein isoform X2 [Rhinoderma darwinii]|uniref:SAP domain-containing ribonucleoprotein isoform X2 n=1 Tax=Rhinoderma darwinii TaxID=43563 RepID=UPI003F661C4B